MPGGKSKCDQPQTPSSASVGGGLSRNERNELPSFHRQKGSNRLNHQKCTQNGRVTQAVASAVRYPPRRLRGTSKRFGYLGGFTLWHWGRYRQGQPFRRVELRRVSGTEVIAIRSNAGGWLQRLCTDPRQKFEEKCSENTAPVGRE